MDKIRNEINKELEDTMVDNDFKIPNLKHLNFESNHKIISFISEFMSLSLNEKIAHYLINKNIRTLKNPLTSDSLFHYICINDDNLPLLKLMKPTIVEINSKNNSGQNLLHISVKNKCIRITKYLLDNNADINIKDNKDDTPLHIAAKNDDYNMIKLLILYNANINVYNNEKETPLDIAKKKKDYIIINYLDNKNKRKKKNSIINNIELHGYDKYLNNKRNTYNHLYLNNNQNTSLNYFSDETKNETENHSLNVYKKKIIAKNIKTPLIKKVRYNRTKSLTNLNFNNSSSTPNKKMPFRYINEFSSKFFESKLIYKRNSPKIINRGKSYKEIFKSDKIKNYELNLFKISPQLIHKNSDNNRYSSNNSKNELNIKTQNFLKKQNSYKTTNKPKIKLKNTVLQNNIHNQKSIPLNIKNNKIRTRNQTKIFINNNTFNNTEDIRNKKEEKNKLYEFLKEIGMLHYFDKLISEGFDDIGLIIKQMVEGFPPLNDTLKEIGIYSPGDRAKILVHLQEISNGFNFEFPFEQVYFKNNRSIQRWLNKEELTKYINNFLEAGYQSLELLLIQMASKYRINEKILKEELYINNDEDINKILKSLEINSEKYVYQLKKSQNIQRTYSKMVNNKNSEGFCIII